MNRILFLCTGNYYRSRFAEVLFNHLAQEAALNWHADSCGLNVKPVGVVNAGAISIFALAGLERRGIPVGEHRIPRQVCDADLRQADIIVALKEAEHRKLIESLHPKWAGRVVYWHVHDLDMAHPGEALAELEGLIRGLVQDLASRPR
ncbi:MAG TPA: low molecular weight phosphatase family protein [Phycisphaerae bacterium]|nr:low molecular weight phosphatase family protein [Phycisphaerae bacterium]